MLNKEMLLKASSVKKDDGKVVMTVGTNNGYWYGYGGESPNCGALNRIPYWIASGIKYYIAQLSDIVFDNTNQSFLALYADTVTSKAPLSLKVTVLETGKNSIFNFTSLPDGVLVDNLLGLKSKNGTEVTLEFAPPPRRLFISLPATSLMEVV